jgi:hypothetical protein
MVRGDRPALKIDEVEISPELYEAAIRTLDPYLERDGTLSGLGIRAGMKEVIRAVLLFERGHAGES